MILNIFPLSATKTIVIFSCLSDHMTTFTHLIDEIKGAESHYRNYLISKTLLKYCENIVIGYKYFISLNDDRKIALLKFFNANLIADKSDYDDSNIYLF
jgi:hypothetical protein